MAELTSKAPRRTARWFTVTGHASANSRSYNPFTLWLAKAEPLAPSRARSSGGSLAPVAAKLSRISSRAESLEVAKVT